MNLKIIRILIWIMAIMFITNISSEFSLPNTDSLINENTKEKQNESLESSVVSSPISRDDTVSEKFLHTLIGVSQELIIDEFGQPTRIEPTRYNYNWWVYPISKQNYVLIGVKEEKVVTIYAIGKDSPTEPFHSGMTYTEVSDIVSISNEPIIEESLNSSYRFELTEDEILTRPLINYNDVYIQMYFDKFTNTLSSVRYFDKETLLLHRPYNLVYRGPLPQVSEPTIAEWKAIEDGAERQIVEITNILRFAHGLKELELHPDASVVAYKHSQDMKFNEFFAHESPTHGGVGERLQKDGINFSTAGENIAAQYEDGISATHGWLNSKGHREIMLSDAFTHIGVGVFKEFYTQEYLTPF